MIDRRGRGSGLPGEAEAAAAQHVGHSPGDLQLRSRRQIQRLLELHDGHRRLIAAADAAIGRPGRVVRAVDQMGDGAAGLLAVGTAFARARKSRPWR